MTPMEKVPKKMILPNGAESLGQIQVKNEPNPLNKSNWCEMSIEYWWNPWNITLLYEIRNKKSPTQ